MLKCKDGQIRAEKEYANYITNLVKLAECEPRDLTKNEQFELIQNGYNELLY